MSGRTDCLAGQVLALLVPPPWPGPHSAVRLMVISSAALNRALLQYWSALCPAGIFAFRGRAARRRPIGRTKVSRGPPWPAAKVRGDVISSVARRPVTRRSLQQEGGRAHGEGRGSFRTQDDDRGGHECHGRGVSDEVLVCVTHNTARAPRQRGGAESWGHVRSRGGHVRGGMWSMGMVSHMT